MLTYYTMLFCSLIFAGMSVLVSKKQSVFIQSKAVILTIKPSNIFYFLSFLPLFLVSALRYGIGVDYNHYAYIFEAITQLDEATHVEIGYELLNRLIGFFTTDYIWIFVITSVVVLFFFALSIKEHSSFPSLSVFLFITLGYYFYSLNSIRHFIALAIFCFSLRYAKKSEPLKFIVFILFATSFHKVALVALPLYFLFTRKFKFSYYIIIATVLAILALLNKQVLDFIFSFVYQSYKGSVFNVNDFSIFNVSLSLVATFFAVVYYKPLLSKAKSNIIFINSAIFSLMFYLTCWWIPTPSRIGHYGTILFIFFLPNVIALEKNPKLRRLYYVLLVAFCLAFMAIMLEGAKSINIGLVPYKSIFER